MVSLESLTSIISDKASEVSKLRAASGLPPLASEEDITKLTKQAETDSKVREAQNELLSAAVDLVRLVSGPVDQLLSLSWSAVDAANLGILVKFKIPQAVPLDHPISSKDLSSAVNLPENILARVVRYSIGLGVFCEPSAGDFGHTTLSATLATNEDIQNIALFSTTEITSTVTNIAEALKYNQENEGSAKAGFNVGGSHGEICAKLAVAYPDLNLVVQDISPEAMAAGRAMLPPEIQERIKFLQHDFFSPQTISADVYLFRHILHDWADEDCVRILQALVPALKHGSRILVSEAVMPKPPAKSLNTLDDKLVRLEDSFMMGFHNAQERAEEEYVTLFSKADKRFHFVGLRHSAGAFQSLLDFEYRTK
ncbi:hypothetical protein B7494_g6311 [Chlorociboria aeruginascens]|nr:hypothetical protein B7494_g6311 [Chlorociboria aeruginascens]